MLIKRPFWEHLLEDAWQEKSIIWLMGIRRVGKTSLCKSLPDIEYFDCELPRVRQLFDDPEGFLAGKRGKRLILDEIHRLDNPSEILKIAADHYPEVKIIATGSSTLGASSKFKDTLTGRKKEIFLTPLLLDELELFGNSDIQHRLLFGGFPAFFVENQIPERDFSEWLESYWAKDIQDMFSVGKRASFLKFAELLLTYSGGQFEASKFAAPCEVSRQTIANYLAVLEETFIAHVIRPFATHKATEIVSAPKVYGFDTGFVCHAKGWQSLRKEDTGLLWEHCVLNELRGKLQKRTLNYWRSRQGNEVDFVLHDKIRNTLTAIECKFSYGHADIPALGKNFSALRRYHPDGENFVVATDIDATFTRQHEEIQITFISAQELVKRLHSED